MSDNENFFGTDGFAIPDDCDKDDYGIIPPGWYPVEIKNVEIKPTKAGDGKLMKVEFSIIGENYTGRRVWNNINFQNKSKEAQAIGQRQLGRLLLACGFDQNDRLTTEQTLLGMQLDINVIIEAGKNGYEDKNIAKSFAKLGHGGEDQKKPTTAPAPRPATATPAASQNTPAPAAPAQNTERNRRPWEKK